MDWEQFRQLLSAGCRGTGSHADMHTYIQYTQLETERAYCMPRTSNMPRDAAQNGVEAGRGRGRCRQGQGPCRGRERSPSPRQHRNCPDGQATSTLWPTTCHHKRPRLARRPGRDQGGHGPRPRPSSGSASPTAVPEDFTKIAYRFIRDWAATQPQCLRPGFPIKRRRSVPRAPPETTTLSVLVPPDMAPR